MNMYKKQTKEMRNIISEIFKEDLHEKFELCDEIKEIIDIKTFDDKISNSIYE